MNRMSLARLGLALLAFSVCPVVVVTLAGCYPPPISTGKPQAQQQTLPPEVVAQWKAFFNSHPELKTHWACPLKVSEYAKPGTWEQLADFSASVCFPDASWYYMLEDASGASYWVNLDSIEIRQQNQVSFWVLDDTPVTTQISDHLDDAIVFEEGRLLYDCDQMRLMLLSSYMQDVFGSHQGGEVTLPQWMSPPPGSVGHQLMDSLCAYRAALVYKPKPQRSIKPKPPKVVEKVRPPTEEEIERALRRILQKDREIIWPREPAEGDRLFHGDGSSQTDGRGGTMDFLPNVRNGDVTMLNTKADQFAPFVRRVAVRVFQNFVMMVRRSYDSGAEAAEEYATVEAVMNKKGNLVAMNTKRRSGSSAFATDRNLEAACRDGFFDRDPPSGAEADDGKIHFIFDARLTFAVDPRGHRVPAWVLMGAGLL